MSERCPSCGQIMPKAQQKADSVSTVERLLRMLKPDRELYRTCEGDWAVTYHKGLVSPTVVQAALETGKLYRVYANDHQCFWLQAKTIDIEATMKIRKTQNTKRLVYTTEPIKA